VSAFDPSVDNATDVIPFPMSGLFRSSEDQDVAESWWLGLLANGSMIAPGNYTYVTLGFD
jgi:hypothetical protein